MKKLITTKTFNHCEISYCISILQVLLYYITQANNPRNYWKIKCYLIKMIIFASMTVFLHLSTIMIHTHESPYMQTANIELPLD